MPYITPEKLLEKSCGSIYKLVILAAKRGLEIAEGQPKLTLNTNANMKPATSALNEISEGKVFCKLTKSKD